MKFVMILLALSIRIGRITGLIYFYLCNISMMQESGVCYGDVK